MGHDLDSLLDATGIGDMAGTQYEKTADAEQGEPFDFRKLAEQCRDAVVATTEHREARGRELIEKTASVAVITKTIDEINEIIGDPVEKIANDPASAEFVRAALDRGHPPEEVASFLKSAGLVEYVGRVARGARASTRGRAGKRLIDEGRKFESLSHREYGSLLRDAARSGNLNRQQKIVRDLERKLGPKDAARVLERSGADLQVPEAYRLLQSAPAATAEIGGRKLKLSHEGMQKVKKVGLIGGAAAGGAALASRGGSDGKGITIVKG
jgi:hypothetical protein